MFKTKFRCGSDPEFFLIDKNSGQFKAVCGMIGADKWNPLQVKTLPEGFTFQEDNVAVEFGVPPAASSESFVKNIQTIQNAFLTSYPGVSFSNLSCAIFPEEEMQNPLVFQFGCEPDYNAYTGKRNPKPKPPHPFMRSAGGHIHVETTFNPQHVVRAIDLTLGVGSVLMDKGEERRKLYGKAGAHRVKPYGVEYRVLSNFWTYSPELINWAWNGVGRALDMVAEGVNLKPIAPFVKQAINLGDKHVAEQLVKDYNLELV